MRVLSIIPFLAGLGICSALSCSTLMEMGDSKDCGAIESENHLLKTKQVLVERRNAVLEDENISIRKEVRDRDANISLLESELRIEQKAHLDDNQQWQRKYDSLSSRLASSEKENAKKIADLNELSRKTEDELNGKIKELSAEMLKRDSEHAHAIENVRKESSEREFDLSRTVESLKKDLSDREDRINRLEGKIRVLESAKDESVSEHNGAGE